MKVKKEQVPSRKNMNHFIFGIHAKFQILHDINYNKSLLLYHCSKYPVQNIYFKRIYPTLLNGDSRKEFMSKEPTKIIAIQQINQRELPKLEKNRNHTKYLKS